MRILIYGFGPYLGYRHNVTQKIIRQFPRQRGIKKLVFPVVFHRGQFIRALREIKPDLILGLGQCSGGRVLRIEQRAVNRKRKNRNAKPFPILRSGRRNMMTTLPLNLGKVARRSADAGEYVCNFSMYVILDYLQRHQLKTRYGFIHVPHNYDVSKALRFLTQTIRRWKMVQPNSHVTEGRA